MAILISDKLYFMSKTVTKDKEGHYVMIKGSVCQEGVTILNIHISKTRAINIWANNDRIEGINRQIFNNSRIFKYPSFNNG